MLDCTVAKEIYMECELRSRHEDNGERGKGDYIHTCDPAISLTSA